MQALFPTCRLPRGTAAPQEFSVAEKTCRILPTPAALVTDYMPVLGNSAWEGATVRHELDMTAGAKYGEDCTDLEADFWKETAVKDQENGAMFHYKTVTTNVLGMNLEKTKGGPLGELLTDEVWVKDSSKQQMLALGIHGQIIYMNKPAEVVIVKLSTQPEQVDMGMFMDAFAAMDAIVDNI